MALTQIDDQAFGSVIQGHQGVQDYISQQRNVVRQEVENAQSQNSGRMIDSLVSAHEDWDARMQDILNNLESMISALQTTRTQLRGQDESNLVR